MNGHGLKFVKSAFSGIFTGIAICLVLLYALNATGLVILAVPRMPALNALLNGIYANLQGSVPFFAGVLALYVIKMRALRRLLAAPRPALGPIASAEHTADLCANLFFGIGVIWTAIGMRGA